MASLAGPKAFQFDLLHVAASLVRTKRLNSRSQIDSLARANPV